MNKIFKVIWSKSKQCYVVVSEMAKNKTGKKKIVVVSILAALAMQVSVVDVSAADRLTGTLEGGTIGVTGLTNGLAIGNEAQSGSNQSIAIGYKSKATAPEVTPDALPATAVGAGAKANGYSTVALGLSAKAEADSATALGSKTSATGDRSVAVGISAAATADSATALGSKTSATGDRTVAVGSDANATGRYASAFGADASAVGNATAVGANSLASVDAAVAVGTDSKATGNYASALGGGATASNNDATAFGHGTVASGASSTALGTRAKAGALAAVGVGMFANATKEYSIAIGGESSSSADNSIAIGKKSFATGENGIAIGAFTTSKGANGVAVGTNGTTAELGGVAVGQAAKSTAENSVAVGMNVTAAGTKSVALGGSATANDEGTIAIGSYGTTATKASGNRALAIGAATTAQGLESIALGSRVNSTSQHSIAIGTGSNASAVRSIAIGADSRASVEGGVALGRDSVADVAGGVTNKGYNPNTNRTDIYSGLTDNVLTSTTGAVSIGNGTTVTRQLTGLAAGIRDTDAVNVAQLKSVNLAFSGNVNTGNVNIANSTLGLKGDNTYITTAANGQNLTISGKTQNIDVTNGQASANAKGMADSKNVADAINKAISANAYHWKLAAENTSTAPEVINKSDTVIFGGDNNITVTRSGKKITTSLNKAITVDTVKANRSVTVSSGGNQITLDGSNGAVTGRNFTGDSFKAGDNVLSNTTLQIGPTTGGNNVTITRDGLSAKAGSNTVKFGTNGISAGGQQITNVSSGGNIGTNAANITDVKNAVAAVTLNLDTNSKTGTVKLSESPLKVIGANGIRTDLVGTNNGSLVVGLDKSTVNATTKGIGLTGDTGSTGLKYLKDGDATFKVAGDGDLVTTKASATGVQVAVDSAKVKDLAVGAVTVSKANTADNPITVTPTAGTNSKDYAIGIDTTKLANQTQLTYKANGANANKVSLANGLNFTDGTFTKATVGTNGNVTISTATETITNDADGKAKVNSPTDGLATAKNVAESINKAVDGLSQNLTVSDGTTDGTVNLKNQKLTVSGTNGVTTTVNGQTVTVGLDATTKTKVDNASTAVAHNISLGADSGTASSQSLKDGDVAFNVKGATGDLVSTKMNGNTVEISTKRAAITSDANTGAASVTGDDGLATSKNVADAINKAADAAKAGAAWNLSANGDTGTKVSGGDTVDFTGDNNITVTQTGKNIATTLNKDLKKLSSISLEDSKMGVETITIDGGTSSAKFKLAGSDEYSLINHDGLVVSNGAAIGDPNEQRAIVGLDRVQLITASNNTALTSKNLLFNDEDGNLAEGSAKGFIFQSAAGKQVQFGVDEIKAGGNKIQEVAEGTDDTDAVNVKQLKDTVASQTLTYRANSAADTDAKSVKLSKGLDFVDGTMTKATVDNDGKVTFDINDDTKTKINDATAAVSRKVSLGADSGTTSSQSLKDGDVAFNVKGATGDFISTKMNGDTVEVSTKRATIDSNATTGAASVTGDDGLATAKNVADAINKAAKASTDAINLKFAGDTNTSAGVVNLKDDTLGIKGDGKYVTTDADGKNLTVKVSEAEVKKSAVSAVTVSTDTTDADNPLTVTGTPSADGTTKDYKVTIDGTKVAAKTNLSYKANDGTAKQVSLADGLNFKDGTLTTATIDDAGVVKYDVKTAAITAGTDGTVTAPATDGVATAKNVADAINAAKKASKTEITANDDEAANATTGNVKLTSTTAADGHTVYNVKLNDTLTFGTGANAIVIDGTAGKATIGSAAIDGVNNTITTGGNKAVTLDGTTGTITGKAANIGGVTVDGTNNHVTGLANTTWDGNAVSGRAATEDQLKVVADAAANQTWQITADKDAATSGKQTGTKTDAKVGKDAKVTMIAGENITINQNERDFTYSLNKDLVNMNSASFNGTGNNTTVINGDSITQTAGTQTNTSTAAGNTVADGTKSTATTADGTKITDGAKTNTSTADSTVIDDGNGNNTALTKDGVTITTSGKDPVSLTKDGLNNGGNKISNIADGTDDTDAVNVRQLEAKSKASKTELTANGGESAGSTTGNIVLTKTTAADGHIIYDNKLNDKVTLGTDPSKSVTVDGTTGTIKAGDGANAVAIDGKNGSVKAGDKIALDGKDGKATIGTVGIDGKDGIITTGGNNPVAVNGKDGVVTGLTNKTWDPNNIESGRAATENQVKSAVENAGWNATIGTEGSGINSTPTATAEKVKTDETVTFKAGNNIMVSQAGKTISYAVNPELKDMKSATFKDAAGNTTVTDGNGITITPGSANPNNPNAGTISLTKDGLNNGNNQLKGIAPGTDDTDAVNVSQLKASNARIGDAIGQVAGEVQRVGAHAAAMAALKPIQYDPLEPTQVMAGVGNYRGETAAALGLAHYTNEDTMFNVGVSLGANRNMVNAGVTHKFGSRPEKKNIPDRYKAGPISSVYVMQDEVSSLKKENSEQKTVIADQAARLNTLEAENERQRQELAETKQGLEDLRAAVSQLLASKG